MLFHRSIQKPSGPQNQTAPTVNSKPSGQINTDYFAKTYQDLADFIESPAPIAFMRPTSNHLFNIPLQLLPKKFEKKSALLEEQLLNLISQTLKQNEDLAALKIKKNQEKSPAKIAEIEAKIKLASDQKMKTNLQFLSLQHEMSAHSIEIAKLQNYIKSQKIVFPKERTPEEKAEDQKLDKEFFHEFDQTQTIPKEEAADDIRVERLIIWLEGKKQPKHIVRDTRYLLDKDGLPPSDEGICTDIQELLSNKKPYHFRPGIADKLTHVLEETLIALKSKQFSLQQRKKTAEKLREICHQRELEIIEGMTHGIVKALQTTDNKEIDDENNKKLLKCPHYIQLVANILDTIIKKNSTKNVDPDPKKQGLFYNKYYIFSVKTLLEEIAAVFKNKSTAPNLFPYKDHPLTIAPEHFICMLIYIKRYLTKFPNDFLNPHNAYNIINMSFCMAYAWLGDNDDLNLNEIVDMPNFENVQINFFKAMDFNITIEKEEYEQFKATLAIKHIENALLANGINLSEVSLSFLPDKNSIVCLLNPNISTQLLDIIFNGLIENPVKTMFYFRAHINIDNILEIKPKAQPSIRYAQFKFPPAKPNNAQSNDAKPTPTQGVTNKP